MCAPRTDPLPILICLVLLCGFCARAGWAQTAKPHAGTPASAATPPVNATGQSPPAKPGSSSADAAASGEFTVSQLGHAVGTAAFKLIPAGGGTDSSSLVNVNLKGLDYGLSKTERLDASSRIVHEQLSATVNGSAVQVTGKPDATQFLLNISSNGRSTTTRLAGHTGAVFLPDFDPGALQTLLRVAAAQNGRDLWAVLPKEAGSVQAVQLATYPDEHGTLNGKAIAVHHLVATIGGAETDLFANAENQLLQAELPQQGFSLVRKGFVLAPPRKPVAPAAQ